MMTTIVELRNGTVTDLTIAAQLMDDEIREELHRDTAPCSAQDFADAYCEKHFEKYGEEFTV